MGRPINDGLLYFSFGCDFYSSKTAKMLRARFGSVGIDAFFYILCECFKNGYFIQADDDFKSIMSADLNIQEDRVKDIITFLLDKQIFDNELYDSCQILTSEEIQRQFQEGIKTRARKKPRKIERYWLLEAAETLPCLKVDDISGNKSSKSENNDTKKRKEKKENKEEKENKEYKEKKEEKEKGEFCPSGSLSVFDFYKNNFDFDSFDKDEKSLQRLIEGYGERNVRHSLEIAVNNNVPKLRYAVGVLKKQKGDIYDHRGNDEKDDPNRYIDQGGRVYHIG